MKAHALFLLFATTGCVEDVAKDKAQATVIEKQPATEVKETPTLAENALAVDGASNISALSAKARQRTH